MNTATKIVIGSLIIIPLVTGSAIAGKKHCDGKFGMRHAERAEMIQERITERLDLTESQQLKLAKVAEVMKEKRKLHRELRKDRPQLVSDGKFDRVAAQKMANERIALMQQHAPEMIAAVGDFYDSLTTDQQAELAEIRNKIKRAIFGHHARALR